MDRTGTNREFVTPALVVGRSYSYDVRATWRDNGQEVSRQCQANIRAGDTIDIDFLGAEAPTLRTGLLPLPRTGPR